MVVADPGCELQPAHAHANTEVCHQVLLHGDAWRIEHGFSYIIEETKDDFSANAKYTAWEQ